MSDRFNNEIAHLARLKILLDSDTVLPLRLGIQRLSLDHRRFKLEIKGMSSIILDPSLSSSAISRSFNLLVNVSLAYPWSEIPNIRFQDPIPFHPHIWEDGRICWGTSNDPQPDMMLADWVRSVVDYLQYHRDSLLQVNMNSPANHDALAWWENHRNEISAFIPAINRARLINLIERSRG